MLHVTYCTMLHFVLFPSILFIPPSYKCGFLFFHTHSESRAITITTFAKDRVQELVSDTNSPLDEYVTGEETQYFTQVSLICETNVRMYVYVHVHMYLKDRRQLLLALSCVDLAISNYTQSKIIAE